jgi:hypothetical protein
LFKLSGENSYRLIQRIEELTGFIIEPPIEVVTDTTEYMNIYRGQVIWLEGREFFVRGDVYEPRFGLEDQPKFWVKRAYDLDSGDLKIIKLEFLESFTVTVGPLRIRCYRSPDKEGEVLDLVRDDLRYMQGETIEDDSGNKVRIIDFIKGKTLYDRINEMDIEHEEFYYSYMTPILKQLVPACEAIQLLHEHELCHGDIRNDHLLIDKETGKLRWIDFDLCQNFHDFDVWSMGNVLQFVIGKSLTTFHEIRTSGRFSQETYDSLAVEDASAFYNYRLMNLKKIYPYVDEKLNKILLHFANGATNYYESMFHLINDLGEVVDSLPPGTHSLMDE